MQNLCQRPWHAILMGCLILAMWPVNGQGAVSERRKDPRIILRLPKPKANLERGVAVFRWWLLQGTEPFRTRQFEVRIRDSKKRFTRTFVVTPIDTSGFGALYLAERNALFTRHGRYYWKVVAKDSAGNQVGSAEQSFFVPPPVLQSISPSASRRYPYSATIQYRHWSGFSEYRSLVEAAYPKTHLQSYWDFGFGFHQYWDGGLKAELQERFVFQSNIGLGAEVLQRLQLLQNAYFALHPWGRGRLCWFSTGLENRTSRTTELSLGFDCALMPGGNVVLFAAWIPWLVTGYGVRGDGVRTLDGWGFEAGFRLFLPRKFIGNVKMFGTDLDFQRLPFAFSIGRLEDRNSGKNLEYRKFGMTYLF